MSYYNEKKNIKETTKNKIVAVIGLFISNK